MTERNKIIMMKEKQKEIKNKKCNIKWMKTMIMKKRDNKSPEWKRAKKIKNYNKKTKN